MQAYRTIRTAAESEYVEKKSRFIGQIMPVGSEEEARGFIEQIKKKHHDARHNCWCYRIHDGSVRYSDDGEPQGTAGQPMLAVFEREGIENFVCVVTRYFGGILLGTGGLTRAYAKSAKDALDAAGTAVCRVWDALTVDCPYALFEQIKLKLSAHGGVVDSMEYGAGVILHALLPEENTQAFSADLRELSAGTVIPTAEEKIFRAAAES